MEPIEAVGHYVQAWGQQTEQDVRLTVARCWTSSSTYTDPITDPVTGIDGLTRLIIDFRVRFPGARLEPAGPPEFHHDVGRLTWTMRAPSPIEVAGRSYGTELPGMDYVRFLPDGRIARVVGFFGNPATATG